MRGGVASPCRALCTMHHADDILLIEADGLYRRLYEYQLMR